MIQWAERARIVAYFEIGTVRDKGAPKPVYLWAAQSPAGQDWAFDSLRIFTWNVRRHRYETAWIERGLRGAGGVTLKTGQEGVQGFSLHNTEKDGSVVRRDYALQGFRAKVAGRTPEAAPEPWYQPRLPATGPPAATQPAEDQPLWRKLWRKINPRRESP